MLVARALAEFGVADDDAETRHNVAAAVEQDAKRLGNTAAICRKCYIRPAVVDAYLSGVTLDVPATRARDECNHDGALDPAERAVLEHLRAELTTQPHSAL